MSLRCDKYSLKTLIQDLHKEFPSIKEVYIFGSLRHRTRNTRSDVDILLVVKEGVSPKDLRHFALRQCSALDFFILDDESVTSCATGSKLRGNSKRDLVNRLDALPLWTDKNGFNSSYVDWEFKVIKGVNPIMTTLSTSLPLSSKSEAISSVPINNSENVQSIKRLKQKLGGAFHVVTQPDHPMLLTGPDLLIGGEGKLTAVLYATRKESENRLRARIIAIRLAMPTNTKVLAVTTDDEQLPMDIVYNCDEIVSVSRAWQEIARYATSDAGPKVDKKALSENKRRHSEKYAFAMLLTTLRRKHELPTIEPRIVIRELEYEVKVEPGIETNELEYLVDKNCSIYETSKPNLGRPSTRVQGAFVTSLTSRSKPVQQLRTLCSLGLVDNYQLDTGVPYQKQDSNLNILLVEDWPTIRHDPEKPIRSAAFGGWIMARSSSPDDIFRLIERSKDPKHVRRWLYA